MRRTGLYITILGLLAIAVGVPGCASTAPSSPSTGTNDPLLKQAHEDYLRGVGTDGRTDLDRLKQARHHAETYIDRHPNGAHVAEAWYRIGQVEFHRGNFNNVIRATENGLDEVDRSHVRAALLLLRGKAMAATGDGEAALTALQSARDLLESSDLSASWINRAELEYHLAGALVRTGSFQEAKAIYQSLAESYSNTAYGENARYKLRFFRPYFSVQVGLFTEEKNAEEMRRTMERDGFDCYVLSGQADGRTQYSVRTGKFDTYREARRMKNRLERNGIEAIVKP